jgi:hypothetical protein
MDRALIHHGDANLMERKDKEFYLNASIDLLAIATPYFDLI